MAFGENDSVTTSAHRLVQVPVFCFEQGVVVAELLVVAAGLVEDLDVRAGVVQRLVQVARVGRERREIEAQHDGGLGRQVRDEPGHLLVHHEVREVLAAGEAQALLNDVELQYVFTGEGKNQVLRGRPVAFALWSETKQEWSVAHIELPRPPIKWNPNGGKPLAFRTLTPGIEARHVKGTGAERLMFAFSRDGDPLKVYGRKFPVFDNNLIKRKQWSAVAQTAILWPSLRRWLR